ncbi:hypothetical protein MY10362_008973 [Beauveria mimosiformis]
MTLMAAGALTGLVAGTSHQGRPKGWCEKADCSKVPAPYSRRGIVSLRDDSCQYSCHLRRLREVAAKSAREKPLDMGIVPSAAEIIRAGEAAPQAPTGQFDVAVTNIPRRSEGPCKFSVDASAKPEQSGADIVCLGSSG